MRIGMCLSVSMNQRLRPNLVPDPNFTNGGTGWFSDNTGAGSGSFAVVSEQGVVTTTSLYFWAYAPLTTVIGRSYNVSFLLPNAQTGTFIGKSDNNQILSKTNDEYFVLDSASAGTITGAFTATATTTYLFFQKNDSGTIVFDNVVVR